MSPLRVAKRRCLLVLLRLTAALTVVFVVKWNFVSDGGNVPRPFHIAGNLQSRSRHCPHFVRAFREGQVLINGGYPGTTPTIMASIAKLGFSITDVKMLPNSHAHLNHAAGLAALGRLPARRPPGSAKAMRTSSQPADRKEDANHHALDKGSVTFVVPEKTAAKKKDHDATEL